MTKLPTILIVDDSATTRAMISRVIQMTGVPFGELLEASNGKEGLSVMEDRPVHLVLADLNMPVLDGAAMIAEMRRRDVLKNIPVVVISAQPDEEQIESLRRIGVNTYLPKPFTAESVKQAIEPILAKIEELPTPELAHSTAPFNMSLAEALAEAMETMAFISPELSDTGELVHEDDLRLARVAFKGRDFKGSLSLSAPRRFGVVVAKNCAVSDAESRADDALKELTNVTCGLFLRKRLGGGAGFVLAPPVMAPDGGSVEGSDESDCVTVTADGFIVAAHVTPELQTTKSHS